MPLSCPECAAPMPESAVFCPGCGLGAPPVERARGSVGGLPVRAAGALAYFLLPAVLFLVAEPYKGNRFLRFHALQSVGYFLVGIAIGALLSITGLFFGLIPALPLLFLSMLLGLGFAVVWMVLVVKALQGEMMKLPWLGEFADTPSDDRLTAKRRT